MSEGRCSRSHIEGEEWNKENKQGKLTSTVLFKRLSEKDLQMERTQNLKSNLNVDVYPEKAIPITTTTENNSNSEEDSREGLTFQEWVRRKDAEKRLKKRLLKEVKNEIRADLLE